MSKRDALIPQGDEDGNLTEKYLSNKFTGWKENSITRIEARHIMRDQLALTKSLEPQIEGDGGLISEELWDEIDKARTEIAELSKKLDDREIDLKEAVRLERERIFNEIDNRNLYILTKDCNNPSPEDWQSLKGGK